MVHSFSINFRCSCSFQNKKSRAYEESGKFDCWKEKKSMSRTVWERIDGKPARERC